MRQKLSDNLNQVEQNDLTTLKLKSRNKRQELG